MPLIPYPDVPDLPGVPLIPRNGISSQSLAVQTGQSTVVSAEEPVWGLYDANNDPIYTPSGSGTLSVVSFGYRRAMDVSDYPVESPLGSNQGSGFASYNKVFRPSEPVLVMGLAGSETEKNEFLAAIDTACKTTELFGVVTPDTVYNSNNGGLYTVSQYSYRRSSEQGATLLLVEISLVEVYQVNSSLTNVPAAQSPSADAQANGGTVSGQTETISPRLSAILNSILHGGSQP
jgi:hypothetical protein